MFEHHVLFRRLENVGGELLAFVDHFAHRHAHGHAPDGEAAAAIGAVSERRAFGCVAVAQLDVVERNAQLVGDDLAERRLVALAVRVGACVDDDRARGRDPYLRRLHQRDAAGCRRRGRAGPEAAQLDPRRQPDAEIATLLAQLGLLLAELRVSRKLQRLVERFLIVARVDHQSEVLREREVLGLDEVLPANVDRIHLQLERDEVDHSLDEVGRLGPPCPPIWIGGDAVGEHADRARRDSLPLIAATGHQAGDRLERAERSVIRAHVHVLDDAHREQRAVLLGRDLAVVELPATMRRGLNRLGTRLDPLHRSRGHARQRRYEVVLRVRADLAAEAAADVRRDHAHLALLQPQRAGHEQADEVRVLARQPHGQLLVEAFVLGQHAPGLHRNWSDPVLEDPLLHHDVRFLERGFRQVEGRIGEVPANVVRSALMRLRGALRERLFEVHDRGQLVVVDLDQVGRVGGLAFGLREHHGDDLALVGDLFFGDREPLGHVLLLGHESRRRRMRPRKLALEVARGVNADDAGRLAGVGDVDALDVRVREWAAYECRIRRALAREVVDVVAVSRDETRVFATMDLGPDKLAYRHVSSLPLRPAPSLPACRSWSWRRSARP